MDIFTENFSAGVDFLGLQDFVGREKIGVIGIFGSGGFALSAPQSDTRIKAVATCSMYDMTAAARMDMDADAVLANKERTSRQRWVDAEHIDLYDKMMYVRGRRIFPPAFDI